MTDKDRTDEAIEPAKDLTAKELAQQGVDVMTEVKYIMKGLLIEMKGANRRHMDASDFNINEFRRLSDAVERMAAQFEKRK